MNKIFLIVICFLSVVFVSAPANAQIVTSTVTSTEIGDIISIDSQISTIATSTLQLEDLISEDPGILPGNPFYFFKEWRRDFRQLMTKDRAKKIEIIFSILGDKAAELKKLKEIAPQNTEAIEKAILSYHETIDQFKGQLQFSQGVSPNINLNKLFKHQQLFDELKSEINQQKNKEIELIQGEINEILIRF